jgi:hypothetical protein
MEVIVLRVEAGAKPTLPFLEKITSPVWAFKTVRELNPNLSCESVSNLEYEASIFGKRDWPQATCVKRRRIGRM